MLILDVLYMLGLNKDNKEHLPHSDLPDAQKTEAAQVICEIHHNRVFLCEFCLLSTYQNQIEDVWLREYLLHLEDLLFPIHVEGHSEDPQALHISGYK
jgi:hypothetical protein